MRNEQAVASGCLENCCRCVEGCFVVGLLRCHSASDPWFGCCAVQRTVYEVLIVFAVVPIRLVPVLLFPQSPYRGIDVSLLLLRRSMAPNRVQYHALNCLWRAYIKGGGAADKQVATALRVSVFGVGSSACKPLFLL